MKRAAMMCRKYYSHERLQCAGYKKGLCRECYMSDSVISYFCDSCGIEIDPEVLPDDGKELCMTCRNQKEVN